MNEDRSQYSLLYRSLPEVVANDLPESVPGYSTAQFLNDSLPIAELVNAAANLSKSRIGLDRPTAEPSKAKPRKKKSGLSQKERRIAGLYRLPKCSISYSEAVPMLRLWESYMYRFLNLQRVENKQWYDPKNGHLWENMHVALMKADYHGAMLKVANSKCNSLVGLQGIVVLDTKYTFTIVCEDNRCKTLPKQSCIFEMYLKKYKFKIFGKYFCIRPNERSSKKTKCSLIPSL